MSIGEAQGSPMSGAKTTGAAASVEPLQSDYGRVIAPLIAPVSDPPYDST